MGHVTATPSPLFVPPDAVSSPLPQHTAAEALEGETLAAWVRETIWSAEADRPRSRQRAVGPSELGLSCSREIAYKLAGTAPVNHGIDPMPSLVGQSVHAHLAETFRSLRPIGRYLVEHLVTYDGISGTLDLYDRRTRTVIDWKTTRTTKIRRAAVDGPPRHYRWQSQVYAAGLREQGEAPARCAVVYIPTDGQLADVMAWIFPVTPADAIEAVSRLRTVEDQLAAAGNPGGVAAQPSRLCPWCPYHRPEWTGDLAFACPGEDNAT